jgi:lysophospholipase L1-like esterase
MSSPSAVNAAASVAISSVPNAGAYLVQLDDPGPWSIFLRGGALQIGLLGAVIALVYLLLAVVLPGGARRFASSLRHLAPRLLLAGAMFFLCGELVARVWFHDGMTFGNHFGPLVRRYERDFVMNGREGPSRGPDVAGPPAAGRARILVQGDSITWGQGVRKESELYTTVALEKLRATHAETEMAVLAFPGREIDTHVEQLQKHGAEVRPDVVVYQWYVNDCEIHPGLTRPTIRPPWRRLFFHGVLSESSFLWSLLDNQGQILVVEGDGGYLDYVVGAFAEDTPAWKTFADVFAQWAAEAKKLTPRVLVILYPHVPDPEFRMRPIYERMHALCARHGIEYLDLVEPLAHYCEHPEDLASSRFDLHPNAKVHAAMGEALAAKLLATWPDHFARDGR